MKIFSLSMFGVLLFGAVACKPADSEQGSEANAFGLGNPKPFVFDKIQIQIDSDADAPTACPTQEWEGGKVWRPSTVELCLTEMHCQEFADGKVFGGKNVKEEFRWKEWCIGKCNPDDFDFTGRMGSVSGAGGVEVTRGCTVLRGGKVLEGKCTDVVDQKFCIITPKRKKNGSR
jgi:hypothetical protein